jgi:hypothetical protein
VSKYGCGSKNAAKLPPLLDAEKRAKYGCGSKNAAKLPPLVNELDELV